MLDVVTLSSRISRQPGVKYTAAAVYVVTACAAAAGLVLLDASFVAQVGIPLMILLTAVPIALAPTATMDARWFQLLPLLVTVQAGIGMWAIVPDPGPAAPIFIFNGGLLVVLASSRPAILAQLVFASAVMLSPIVAGQSELPSSLMVVASIGVMWGFAAMTSLVWWYADDAATQLDELAQRDALTGAGNRRMLDERLEYELVRHIRTGAPLALVVLDLNEFKDINDRLGHAAGDDVLRDVARAIAGAVRAQDTVARAGGDEFCVIAPDTDQAGAAALVAHVRAAIAEVTLEGRALGAAIGSAVAPADGLRARELFEVADAAQREDKPGGRGRAVLASTG